MSIPYTFEKIKKVGGFVAIFILVPLLGYGILKISAEMSHKSGISVIYPQNTGSVEATTALAFGNAAVAAAKEAAIDRTVVASKKGTKYYLLSCSGAKTISPENKITFSDPKAAEKAGYTPAKNCKNLILLNK